MSRMPTRGVLGIVIVATLLRLILAATLGSGNDEAYYGLYLDHLDWSYFDHPPMVALVALFGETIGGGQRSLLALRLGFVLLFAGSTLLVARLARRAYGETAAAPTALALNASWFFGAAVGTFVLPDGPLLFFWLLTIDRLMTALDADPDRSLVPWLGVGLAWGGALLSKYHAVFLPAGFLAYCLVEPFARRTLKTPGPYLATAVGLLIFTPVISWNARNDWASFVFQGARASGSLTIDPAALFGTIVAQVFYLLPWMAVALAVVAVRIARHPSSDPDQRRWDRLFLALALVPFVFFLAVSAFRPVLPHWGLIGVAALMPPLGAAWTDRLARQPRSMRRRLALIALAPIVVTALALAHVNTGWLQGGGSGRITLLPPEADPSRDLFGWDQIADELRRRGLLDRPDTFVFTGHWHVSGQLARAIGPGTPVLCYHEGDARGFSGWSRPDDWVGRDGILVAIDDRSTEPQCFDRWFERIEPIASFNIMRGGVPIRPVRLFRCVRQTRPFRFDAPPGG
ncbi:glycosyltransferase family 39 protein [Tautonia rosea]|uniref:glycosyltransferase family 39 protein n=1 Tax=Tautonia rosea TaxID=2728037 RepID=UPI001473CE9F|nr:glycosyltransferase family 39 protein [Tautonia rosea]